MPQILFTSKYTEKSWTANRQDVNVAFSHFAFTEFKDNLLVLKYFEFLVQRVGIPSEEVIWHTSWQEFMAIL